MLSQNWVPMFEVNRRVGALIRKLSGLAIESKQSGIGIMGSRDQVRNKRACYGRKCNAVAAISQGELCAWKAFVRADIGETSPGLCKSPRPSCGQFPRDVGKHLAN